jgi:hypothetical protein
MITYFETVPSISCGSIYVSAADGKLKQIYNVSVKEAEKELAKLEEKLGRKAQRIVNPFDNTIVRIEISGFLN